MNQETLLEYIYEMHCTKFPEKTKEQAEKELRAEVANLQNARKDYYFGGGSVEDILNAKANCVIIANRLWHDYNDELAWLILDTMYDYDMARCVEERWKEIERTCYVREPDGTYSKKELYYGKYPIKKGKK